MENSKLLKEANKSTGWNNHLPLVYLALKETGEGNLVEMGMGDGSTVQLSNYALESKRKLLSYDNNAEWLNKYKHFEHLFHSINLVNDYSVVYENNTTASVILIDHTPGEDRKFRAVQYKDEKCIIICHDAQPKPNAGDYQFETIFKYFKYSIRLQPPFNIQTNDYPTGAIALSNHYDLSKWDGLVFGEWKVSNTYQHA